MRGCEYVIRRAIHQTPLADRTVKEKKSLETPFDAVPRHHPPSSFVRLRAEEKRRRGTTNWPNYYQFFTRQYTPSYNVHKIYIFFSLIRLIYCFVIAAICAMLLLFISLMNTIFFPASSSTCVCALLSFIIRIDFFRTAFHTLSNFMCFSGSIFFDNVESINRKCVCTTRIQIEILKTKMFMYASARRCCRCKQVEKWTDNINWTSPNVLFSIGFSIRYCRTFNLIHDHRFGLAIQMYRHQY